jgi:TPR repeat protein
MPRYQPLEWELERDPDAFGIAQAFFKQNPVAGFPKMLAMAEQESLLSMLTVAGAYLKGNGIPLDKEQAEYWYRQVANAGSVFAHHCLGRLYLQQKRYGEAKTEFEFSGARGYAPANLDLAKIYLWGWGEDKSEERARRYMQRAADGGNLPAKVYLTKAKIRESPNWLAKIKGVLTLMSVAFQMFSIAKKSGFDDVRLRR